MFRDYYTILEIDQSATQEEIKSAFKRQALKWHPDRNPGIESTSKMQLINEAKLILLDLDARGKYDVEYNRYKFQKTHKTDQQKSGSQKKGTGYSSSNSDDSNEWKGFETKFDDNEFDDNEFGVNDEELNRWMNNAKRQSVDLAKKTIEDFKGMVNEGTKAAAKEAVSVITIQIVLGIIISLIILLSRACDK
jgi:curved DNA-binding protein CbpA